MQKSIYHNLRRRLPLVCSAIGLSISASLFAQSEQVMSYDGGRLDLAASVAVATDSSIYVSGLSLNTGGADDILLKYDIFGSLVWNVRFQGTGEFEGSSVSDIAIGPNGNIYLAGAATRFPSVFSRDIGWVVSSVSPSGNQRWLDIENTVGADSANAIAVDPNSGVVVAGQTNMASGAEWLVIKYSFSGQELWRRNVTSPGASDEPVDIEIDSMGNIFVLGSTGQVGNANLNDSTIVKFDTAGNLIWRNDHNDTAISNEFPADLVVDSAGNLYATGTLFMGGSPEGGIPTFFYKVNESGTTEFSLSGNGFGGLSLDVHPQGGVVVSGSSFESNTQFDVTSRFDSNGDLVWVAPFASSSVQVDIDGSVYLPTGPNHRLVKLDLNGQVVSDRTVNQGFVFAEAVIDNATGDVVTTGHTSGSRSDIVTIRYIQGSAPVPLPDPEPNPDPTPEPEPEPTLEIPNAPDRLKFRTFNRRIVVKWKDRSDNESGFIIERSSDGVNFSEVARVGPDSKRYPDKRLRRRTTFHYRVIAFNDAGESASTQIGTASTR